MVQLLYILLRDLLLPIVQDEVSRLERGMESQAESLVLEARMDQVASRVHEVLSSQRDVKDLLMRFMNAQAAQAPQSPTVAVPSEKHCEARAALASPVHISPSLSPVPLVRSVPQSPTTTGSRSEHRLTPTATASHPSPPSWMSGDTVVLTPNTFNSPLSNQNQPGTLSNPLTSNNGSSQSLAELLGVPQETVALYKRPVLRPAALHHLPWYKAGNTHPKKRLYNHKGTSCTP